MKKIYLLTLVVITAARAFSQQVNDPIPIKKGDAFTIRTTTAGPAKNNKTVKRVLQVIGIGAATFQSTTTITRNDKSGAHTATRNWIIPAGVVLALGADKISGVVAPTRNYIKYTLYGIDGHTVVGTDIARWTRKSLKKNKGVLLEGVADVDGFLSVEVIGKAVKVLSKRDIVVQVEEHKVAEPVRITVQIAGTQTPLIGIQAPPVAEKAPSNMIEDQPTQRPRNPTIVKGQPVTRVINNAPADKLPSGNIPAGKNTFRPPMVLPVKKGNPPAQKRSFPLLILPLYYRKQRLEVETEEEEEPNPAGKRPARGLKALIDPWLKFVSASMETMDDADEGEGGYGINEGECDDGCAQGGEDPGGEDPGTETGTQPGECDDGCAQGGEDPGGEDPGGEDPGGQDPGGEDPGGEDPGGEDPGGEDPGGEDPGGEDPGGEDPGGEDPGGEGPGGSWGEDGWDDGGLDDGGMDDGTGDDGSDGGGDPPYTPITLARLRELAKSSPGVIGNLEALAGITDSNFASKVRMVTTINQTPTAVNWHIEINQDQTEAQALQAYAHELNNAAHMTDVVDLAHKAHDKTITATQFADAMLDIETLGIIAQVYVAVDQGLPNVNSQEVVDIVVKFIDHQITENDMVAQIRAITKVKGKDDNNNPIYQSYIDLYNSL